MRVRPLAVAAFVLAGLCAANAQDTSPQQERYDLMREIGKNTGALGKIAKGEEPYDAAVVDAAASAIAANAEKFVTLFPEGTETGNDTRALPAIWEDRDTFNGYGEALVEGALAVKAAAPDGLDAFRPAFGQMAGSCRDCHQSFRAAKN